jgi:hypothetical protein
MFARKLSRLAGLVFVLAAFIGGGGAFVPGAEHGTGGMSIVTDSAVVESSPSEGTFRTFEYDWH